MIRSVHRKAVLRIVGVEAPDEVRRLDRLPGVTFVGPVDDMAGELRRAWMTICPLRFGSGRRQDQVVPERGG